MIRKAIIVVLTVAAVAAGCMAGWLTLIPRRMEAWRWGECPESGLSALIVARRGIIVLSVSECSPPSPGYTVELVNYSHLPRQPPSRLEAWAGLKVRFDNGETDNWSVMVTARGRFAWGALIFLAAYPAIVFIRGPLRRRRRRKRGLCLKCGYDLTGNVSGVCPERGEGICSTSVR